MLDAWQVNTLAASSILVIALWVSNTYGRQAAVVMLALSGITLGCVWIAYGVAPVEAWRRDNILVGLLIFAIPAAAGGVLALVRARRRGCRLDRQSVVYLILLWVTPAVLLYVSQRRPWEGEFANLMWWAATTISLYVLVPVAYARWAGQSVRGYGLSVAFIRREAILIALIAPVALALAWFISADARFQEVYPFYDGEGAGLLAFEIVYGASFVALEFFFRGFLVFAGQPVLGVYAIPVMAMSYCLLHLGKPMPETVASLVGGLILGYVALRLRSILAGVVAHLTLAWGVDAAVLSRS